ncbi:MAG: 2'-5' RNA ligase family protein [Chloroflexota bacterium]|nr:2'-5' RNA ligase family protein [Chloroflexota bacterium]
MYAIISELNPAASADVNAYWRKLSRICGLKAIYHMPTPHLTWLVSQEVDVHSAALIISQIASQEDSISSHTSGLGIFTGEHPVLYLPIVKSQQMITLHQTIWNLVKPMTKTPNDFYSPKAWVPHITLALNDLTNDNLACAVNSIAFEEIELKITIDNLSFAEYEKEIAGEIIRRFNFQHKVRK